MEPTFTHVADEATTTGVRVGIEGATTITSGLDAGLDSGNIHESPLRSHEAPLHEGHTSGSAEDSLQLKELMVFVPKLVTRISNLEKELHQTKTYNWKADNPGIDDFKPGPWKIDNNGSISELVLVSGPVILLL
ncbi:hypothetical protein Tco_1052463 [Tanacetum coccineum]